MPTYIKAYVLHVPNLVNCGRANVFKSLHQHHLAANIIMSWCPHALNYRTNIAYALAYKSCTHNVLYFVAVSTLVDPSINITQLPVIPWPWCLWASMQWCSDAKVVHATHLVSRGRGRGFAGGSIYHHFLYVATRPSTLFYCSSNPFKPINPVQCNRYKYFINKKQIKKNEDAFL